MGQQQLILLVLATVIVGLAIVVGIAAFTQGGDNANADAMLQDAVTMANEIQSWAQTPTPFGGPAEGENFTDATFAVLGRSAEEGDDPNGLDAEHSNLNGTYDIIDRSGEGEAAELTIRGRSFEDNGETVRNEIQVRLCSSRGDDAIRGANITIGGQDTGTDAPPAC